MCLEDIHWTLRFPVNENKRTVSYVICKAHKCPKKSVRGCPGMGHWGRAVSHVLPQLWGHSLVCHTPSAGAAGHSSTVSFKGRCSQDGHVSVHLKCYNVQDFFSLWGSPLHSGPILQNFLYFGFHCWELQIWHLCYEDIACSWFSLSRDTCRWLVKGLTPYPCFVGNHQARCNVTKDSYVISSKGNCYIHYPLLIVV